MARPKQYITFHDATTTASNGQELLIERAFGNSPQVTIDDVDIITLEISGTTTTATVHFEVKIVPDGNYLPVAGLRLSDFALATSTTTMGQAWIVDVGAVYSFRARVSGISDGTVTVKGKTSKYI